MAIESRLVSKTIENAQSRVEGYNFDIRKRVVEYDDVINKQRETIYAERDKVLNNEDLGGTVLGFVEEELELLVERTSARSSRTGTSTASRERSRRWASRGEGLDAEASRSCGTQDEHPRRASLDAAAAQLEERERELRRGDLGHRRARRPAARHRHAVGGPPDRARRLPPRRRPARLRRHRPARGVQARGLQALRGAARLHPPPGRHDDLPGQRPAPRRRRRRTDADAHAHARSSSRAPGAAAPRGRRNGRVARTARRQSAARRPPSAAASVTSSSGATAAHRSCVPRARAGDAAARCACSTATRPSACASSRAGVRVRPVSRRTVSASSAATTPAGAAQARSSSAATAPDGR